MADEMQNTTPGAAEENAALRRQLLKRLSMAGGLVALLLALLALFDHLSQPVEEIDVPEFTEAVPVAPKKVLTQPVSAPPEESVVPEEAAAPEAEDAPAPPVIAATPEQALEAAPTVSPATSRRPAGKKPVVADEVVAEGTSSPSMTGAAVPPRERIYNQGTAAASRPAQVVELTPPVRPARQVEGFLLQAGVFASAERAEELHARLTLNGIPTQVETRVQVGPFHTRQEALAAQAKLKALGIDSLLVLPKGAR